MAITFDGVTLDKPDINPVKYTIAQSEAILLDGKRDQDSEANYGTEYTINCKATNRTNLELLLAKIGTAGSLLFDSDNMGTYRIVGFLERPSLDYSAYFLYTVTFRRHTT